MTKTAVTVVAITILLAGAESISGGLRKTGQTTIYRTGDDGYYQKGIARSYTDNHDGTVTDNVTGLMWAKDGNAAGCLNGQNVT